jgi:signal transduction histidine kinase
VCAPHADSSSRWFGERSTRARGSGSFRSPDALARNAHVALLTEDMTLINSSTRQIYRFEPSEAERYQDRLRALMANLLLAEETERRQLAADLHDGLTQILALIGMKVASLRELCDARAFAALDQIGSLVRQADAAARSVGYELSPPVLHDVGLEPAVVWLVDSIHTRYGLSVTCSDDGQAKPTDERTRVVLFRGIRELLINAAKHASAKSVVVSLQRVDDTLVATVEDDGVGMDVNLPLSKGSGLFALHERIEHVGGRIEIKSSPGSGTRIQITVPCVPPPQIGAGARS